MGTQRVRQDYIYNTQCNRVLKSKKYVMAVGKYNNCALHC